jgi:hypothetical protein
MTVRGEKLGAKSIDQSANMLMIMSGVLFLMSSKVRLTLFGQCERLSCTGTGSRKHTSEVHGLAWKAYVSCVSCFPYRVYIDLNHRDSRI